MSRRDHRMNVAFVSTMQGSRWGGSEALWSGAACRAAEQGHQVIAATYRWSPAPPALALLQRRGVTLIDRGRPPSGRHRRLSGLVESRLRRLTAFRPDVVCISQGGTYDILATRRLRSLVSESGIPYVVLCHLSIDRMRLSCGDAEIASQFFLGAACVGFSSHWGQETTERQLVRRLPNARVLQNPLNLSESRLLQWPESSVAHLACVARLDSAAKGQDLLLAVLAQPEWKERAWRLKFYGEGPDSNYLARLTSHYGLSSRVTFEGHATSISGIWSENQILILPSRVEGTPMALLEAQALGRPAVVTDVGDCAAWTVESETGFVAEAPTVSSLRAALERAWSARPAWSEMGSKAHVATGARLHPDPGSVLLDIMLRAGANRQADPGVGHSRTQVRAEDGGSGAAGN